MINAKLFLTKTHRKIDMVTDFFGVLVSWLVILLVFLVVYDVVMRYFFQGGSIGLQETAWHLFSIIFLLGGAYTLKHDKHVRLDIFYRSNFLNDKHRAFVDIIGSIFILLPFCILIIICSESFVSLSFLRGESSPDPGGLPFRWIIKLMIPVGFALLVLQAIAEIAKKILIIIEKK